MPQAGRARRYPPDRHPGRDPEARAARDQAVQRRRSRREMDLLSGIPERDREERPRVSGQSHQGDAVRGEGDLGRRRKRVQGRIRSPGHRPLSTVAEIGDKHPNTPLAPAHPRKLLLAGVFRRL